MCPSLRLLYHLTVIRSTHEFDPQFTYYSGICPHFGPYLVLICVIFRSCENICIKKCSPDSCNLANCHSHLVSLSKSVSLTLNHGNNLNKSGLKREKIGHIGICHITILTRIIISSLSLHQVSLYRIAKTIAKDSDPGTILPTDQASRGSAPSPSWPGAPWRPPPLTRRSFQTSGRCLNKKPLTGCLCSPPHLPPSL